jgi:phosphatidylglycerophosphate synthase
MLEGLKPLFNSILRPLVRPLVRMGIRPNHLTLSGLCLTGGAAWFIYTGRWTTACIIALAGSLFDGLDGIVARESGRQSVFGAILDSCSDRLGETLLLFGVLGRLCTASAATLERVVFSLPLRVWGILFCFTAVAMSIMVSYVKARCEGEGVSCPRGLLQRPERIILLCAGLIGGPDVMVWVLAALSLLAAVTVLQRLCAGLQNIKRER